MTHFINKFVKSIFLLFFIWGMFVSCYENSVNDNQLVNYSVLTANKMDTCHIYDVDYYPFNYYYCPLNIATSIPTH